MSDLMRIDEDDEVLRRELPTIPDAFRRTEYEGWLEESIKRFQLKRYQKTQAERLAVLRQINAIRAECLTLARDEASWRYLEQEDRMRQKRLDLDEMRLDQQMQDFLYERDQRLAERVRAAAPPRRVRKKKADPVAALTAEIAQAVRTEAGVREVFNKLRQEHPEQTDWLNDWEIKLLWDLKEKKWF